MVVSLIFQWYSILMVGREVPECHWKTTDISQVSVTGTLYQIELYRAHIDIDRKETHTQRRFFYQYDN